MELMPLHFAAFVYLLSQPGPQVDHHSVQGSAGGLHATAGDGGCSATAADPVSSSSSVGMETNCLKNGQRNSWPQRHRLKTPGMPFTVGLTDPYSVRAGTFAPPEL